MRSCAVCGRSIDGRRADCLTCSDKCRTAAWRSRKARAAARASGGSPKSSVTVRDPLVTLTALVGGPCPDPNRCRHYMRFASGPWTCEYCHPRVAVKEVEAAAYSSAIKTPADNGRALRRVREDAGPWGEVA
jgi:hypothetical protein